MLGSLKIVGTNLGSKNLKNKIFDNCDLKFDNGIHFLFLNEKKYLLDIKKTFFIENKIILEGIISDDESFAGKIVVEFIPKNLDIS
jgi:hypothetical protein